MIRRRCREPSPAIDALPSAWFTLGGRCGTVQRHPRYRRPGQGRQQLQITPPVVLVASSPSASRSDHRRSAARRGAQRCPGEENGFTNFRRSQPDRGLSGCAIDNSNPTRPSRPSGSPTRPSRVATVVKNNKWLEEACRLQHQVDQVRLRRRRQHRVHRQTGRLRRPGIQPGGPWPLRR